MCGVASIWDVIFAMLASYMAGLFSLSLPLHLNIMVLYNRFLFEVLSLLHTLCVEKSERVKLWMKFVEESQSFDIFLLNGGFQIGHK